MKHCTKHEDCITYVRPLHTKVFFGSGDGIEACVATVAEPHAFACMPADPCTGSDDCGVTGDWSSAGDACVVSKCVGSEPVCVDGTTRERHCFPKEDK